MMRVGCARHVIAKLTAWICLMTLKEHNFLLLMVGRSTTRSPVFSMLFHKFAFLLPLICSFFPLQNVFPEAVLAGNNQDNSSRFSSDDSEDNDYDPDCPEVDEKAEGDESSSDKSDGSNEFSKSDDIMVSPNNKQCQGLPSDDSEDDDYDPDAPEIDEQVNQGSSSSDFTSDSDDFGATLGPRNFSNKKDGLDGERRFGRLKKETLKDELLSVLESNSGQDNASVSAKRHVERLDYKRLHDVSAHDSPFASHASATGFSNLKLHSCTT